VAVRVVDTREPHLYEFQRLWDNHIRVPIAGKYGVPADASAVVATVTAVNIVGGNWLTVVPTGTAILDMLAQNRLVSVLNMSYPWEATANLTQVKLGGGSVDLFSMGPCEMILDVIGYYKPVTAAVRAGRFIALQPARRAVDTRETQGYVVGGEKLLVDLTGYVPREASSVVLNLTATECVGPAYFTAYPYTSATVPFVSSLNVNQPGETRAAAVIVPVPTQNDGGRYVRVYAHDAAKLIVDVTGYFTSSTSAPSETGLFVPADPVRILDTRTPGQIGKLWPGWYVEGAVPAEANFGGSAVAVNLTGVEARGPGFLTMARARIPLPPTSNLNFTYAGQVVPNQVITPITQDVAYQVYSHSGAHIVVDYTGYYTGQPGSPQIGPPVNPPPPPAPPTWVLRVPAIGITSQVRAGGANSVTNAGHSWHWTGTGYLGQDAHVAAFAHRTEHGGVYRNIHLLRGGDRFTLSTSDGRVFTYEVVARYLTDHQTGNILDATRFVAGTTFSLIACTRPDFQPTSTSWRIVVTGVLVGWS
jgi:hypothetical protein